MAGRVLAPDHNALFLPAKTGTNADARRTIAQGQTTEPPTQVVGIGAVQQQIGVHRNIVGFQLHVHGLAELLGVLNRLIQHVVRMLLRSSGR